MTAKKRSLINWKIAVAIALGCANAGISFKMFSFFDVWVYFPAFPNILDWLWIAIGSIILMVWVLDSEVEKYRSGKQ